MSDETPDYPIGEVIVITDTSDGDNVPKVCVYMPDLDGDMIQIEFETEGGIIFHTTAFDWITFPPEALQYIAELTSTAKALNDELYALYDGETDTWGDFSHLVTHRGGSAPSGR